MNTGTADSKLSLLADLKLDVRLEVGRAAMSLRDILALSQDSIVPLSRAAGASLDLYVGERLVARGDLVSIDGRYGLRVTEVLSA